MAEQPLYLKQKGTNRVYPYQAGIAKRDDMEPCEGPVVQSGPEVAKEIAKEIAKGNADISGDAETDAVVRLTQIKEAISKILPEEYGQAVGSRPSLPKVAQVSKICGFKVSVDEIIEAMKE